MAVLTTITPNNTAAVLLASGASLRFGSDKLGANFNGQTLLERSALNLFSAGCFVTAGVIAQDQKLHGDILTDLGLMPLENNRAVEGISASIQIGVEWAMAQKAEAVLIALADMPFVGIGHFQQLFARVAGELTIAFTECDGQRMPPALFSKKWFAQLQSLHGDIGAKPILKAAPEFAGVPTKHKVVTDIDTIHDLERVIAKNLTKRSSLT